MGLFLFLFLLFWYPVYVGYFSGVLTRRDCWWFPSTCICAFCFSASQPARAKYSEP